MPFFRCRRLKSRRSAVKISDRRERERERDRKERIKERKKEERGKKERKKGKREKERGKERKKGETIIFPSSSSGMNVYVRKRRKRKIIGHHQTRRR